MSNRYFEAICTQEEQLQSNAGELDKAICLLQGLAKEEGSDDEKIQLLKELGAQYEKLSESSTELYLGKFESIEADLVAQEKTEFTGSNRNIENIAECAETLQELQQDMQAYMNMLDRLSVDVAQYIDTTDVAESEICVDKQAPTSELLEILNGFIDDNEEPIRIKARLDEYLNNIKMERVQYALENKFTLEERLKEVQSEVSRWRNEWDTLENSLFGDSTSSLVKLIQRNEQLTQKLNDTSA